MTAIGISVAPQPIRRLAPFAILTGAGMLPLLLPAPFFPPRGLPFSMLGLAVIASTYSIEMVAAARALRAPVRLAVWATAALLLVTLESVGPSRSTTIAPYLGGELAAADRAEWIEMRRALNGLPPGAVLGAGYQPRPNAAPGSFSLLSRPSMVQLPILDGRRTLYGLLQESAPVSQYVREAERNLGGRDLGLVHPFADAELRFDLGVAQAAALGTRYLVLVGDTLRFAAAGHPGVKILVKSDRWAVAEITESNVMVSLSAVPHDPCTSESACREWFANLPADAVTVQGTTIVRAWQEDFLDIDDGRIRFRTDTPGLPHLLRLSYFPGWRLETPGEGLRRYGPNHVLVIPHSREVELSFSPGWPVTLGRALSALGVLLLTAGLSLARGRPRPRKIVP
jgi:hypothetical protein